MILRSSHNLIALVEILVRKYSPSLPVAIPLSEIAPSYQY